MQSVSEIPFVAGNVALDFVNTAEERGHAEADDALRTAADLRLWGRRYGLISRLRISDEDAEAELEKSRRARELLYELFSARVGHRPLPKRVLADVAELVADAYRAGRLKAGPDGSLSWQWDRSELCSVRHVAVTAAVDLLHADPSPRLKRCPGDGCGWFFLDSTKRGNRRWCSMSDCGQDAKNLSRRKTMSSSDRRRLS
jgi:predicted RNA-binding Zn ribbon-like protein